MIQIVIQLTEVELTTWSIMFKSRPSGQSSGQVGSFFVFYEKSMLITLRKTVNYGIKEVSKSLIK